MNRDVAQALSEQRLASQHHPKTWSAIDQFDCSLWEAHDANAGRVHYGPYALCEACREEWREWKNQQTAGRLSAGRGEGSDAHVHDQQCE